ncbi:TIGR03088 family PEP-CTERM/XrtA system glycosyltransferase [Accumulibacter sp.]|uniref:TIGR03088 family PEP-CTERM/XrtA system glycosyltransferase n=1 Tax=Accumulibacter sp. TaxID=2053492 RepID=UPI00260154E5|nr:TIGR03088 family PEP-CTERM/XrtA system glycosyltransferase [Accumulibacter sp.]MCM8595413.1 TIGR03088 family PEP-CTERM/XrtA system glycosyltransferase [Accumulibacter sp.]MCM8626406.1 TIGR03088 family PEP-CTERM/XrtA system glycosyltransferase [Accumulibacter sp.]MDS4049560.1 TIGR03088 family PEP-CTERM/XrtA system glycosyltransferase [Accumulibacter sp.]
MLVADDVRSTALAGDVRPLILHVIHQLRTGGLENGLVNLINCLPESRFRHAVVCIEDFSDFRHRLERGDAPVIALHRSQIGVWRLRKALFSLCRRLRPTIVHSRNQSGLDALLPARLAGVRRCIHGEHGWDVNDLEGRQVKPAMLRRLHSPLVDRYITVSDHLRDYLVERVRIAPQRVVQIVNGVDTARFCPSAEPGRSGLPDGFRGRDALVVCTVGRLQPVKDQETLLRAFALLVAGGRPEARLVVAGDGPMRTALVELAASLGIADRCWFPGTVSNVAGLLRNCDVFVLPSLAEGISNTLLEAMASGLPVLATAVGGNRELITEGENGWLFEPRDVATLVRLLSRYVDEPAMLRDQGRRAREMAVTRFSLPTMVGRYQAVYEELCNRT